MGSFWHARGLLGRDGAEDAAVRLGGVRAAGCVGATDGVVGAAAGATAGAAAGVVGRERLWRRLVVCWPGSTVASAAMADSSKRDAQQTMLSFMN